MNENQPKLVTDDGEFTDLVSQMLIDGRRAGNMLQAVKDSEREHRETMRGLIKAWEDNERDLPLTSRAFLAIQFEHNGNTLLSRIPYITDDSLVHLLITEQGFFGIRSRRAINTTEDYRKVVRNTFENFAKHIDEDHPNLGSRRYFFIHNALHIDQVLTALQENLKITRKTDGSIKFSLRNFRFGDKAKVCKVLTNRRIEPLLIEEANEAYDFILAEVIRFNSSEYDRRQSDIRLATSAIEKKIG